MLTHQCHNLCHHYLSQRQEKRHRYHLLANETATSSMCSNCVIVLTLGLVLLWLSRSVSPTYTHRCRIGLLACCVCMWRLDTNEMIMTLSLFLTFFSCLIDEALLTKIDRFSTCLISMQTLRKQTLKAYHVRLHFASMFCLLEKHKCFIQRIFLCSLVIQYVEYIYNMLESFLCATILCDSLRGKTTFQGNRENVWHILIRLHMLTTLIHCWFSNVAAAYLANLLD